MENKYGFGKMLNSSFNQALEKVIQELKKEGFGVISEIDVAATIKNKLNLDMPPYKILGACNPMLAHSALEIDPSIGLLLPCNVVLREDNAGKVYVEFMDSSAVLNLVNMPEINQIALDVKQRLECVMNAL